MGVIDIPAEETGLPFALEQYYEELLKLIGDRYDQPLLLNNTITTFDIVEEAPFYTEGVYRFFVDRVFKVSPDDLGTAIQSDRFSKHYEDVLNIATTQFDLMIADEVRDKIDSYEREVSRVRREFVKFEKEVTADWDEIAKSEGLDQESPNYHLRRLNFLERILYADQAEEFTREISSYQRLINQLRMSAYTPAQQKLVRVVDELSETYKVARPFNIYFERDFPESTVLTFADPKVRTRQLCDISPAIYPSLDLVRFQLGSPDIRGLTVEEKTEHTTKHERTWGASGSGGFKAFGLSFGGSGGGSGESKYRSEFKSLKSFSLKFDGLEEVYANRGLWFDPSLFGEQGLKDVFDTIPGTRNLEYVGVSLIIGKGLTLTLDFDESLETENWSRRRFSGGGGAKIFGFKFGGRGSYTKYDYDYSFSSDKKTVTFSDDPKQCRLLAVRLERVYQPKSVDQPENASGFSEAARYAFENGVKTGKLSLSEYQALKIGGFPDEAMRDLVKFLDANADSDPSE